MQITIPLTKHFYNSTKCQWTWKAWRWGLGTIILGFIWFLVSLLFT